MSAVRKLEESRAAMAVEFNLAEYTRKVFGMFGGEETDIRLRVHNSLAGAVIDRFGKEAAMSADGDSHFIVRARVAVSPVFFGWLFQFGERCELLSPQGVRDELVLWAEQFLARLKGAGTGAGTGTDTDADAPVPMQARQGDSSP
jgi:predicted DNA-binding transcriptional regulator YafY